VEFDCSFGGGEGIVDPSNNIRKIGNAQLSLKKMAEPASAYKAVVTSANVEVISARG
jgi:hypothetical protein